MWYMIYSEDIDQSLNRRSAVRDQHLARLRTLQNQGRLLIAGPLPNMDSETPESAGFSGSLLVLAFDNLEQAQQWACEGGDCSYHNWCRLCDKLGAGVALRISSLTWQAFH